MQALAEAERDFMTGPGEGIAQLGVRRDSAEDMQFLASPSHTGVTAGRHGYACMWRTWSRP